MCLIAFAIGTHPQLPLLLAANRDEALDRPTLALHRWHTPAGVSVIGGRDGRDHGTWLACAGPDAPPHAANRVAMLTNVRHGQDTTAWPRSRGELPLLWLNGSPLDTLLDQLDPAAYGAFNLVVGDVGTGAWHWVTNRDDQHHTTLHCQALEPGVYGLSNARLNTPWPKTLALRAALEQALAPQESAENTCTSTQSGLIASTEAALWDTLANPHVWPDAELPSTGVPIEWEQALSAIWVDHPPTYGTRTSALLAVHAIEGDSVGWDWRMQEQTWRPTPRPVPRQEHWRTLAHTGS